MFCVTVMLDGLTGSVVWCASCTRNQSMVSL